MSTETENNLMDKRKEPLDKNWKSSTIKYDTQLFAENQIEFMKEIGISINFSNISDDDYVAIEEKVSEYLQKKGFNEDYSPNEDGKMCESILDML